MARRIISVDELVKGILDGRRDFSNTTIPYPDLAAHEDYKRLLKYLKVVDLKRKPVMLINSDWRGLVAPGLWLPHCKGASAHLSGAHLDGAHLNGADFPFVELNGAELNGADLAGADFYNADLNGANLTGARLTGADFHYVCFVGTHLNGVKGLGKALNLGSANFYYAKITDREREIIEKARKDEYLCEMNSLVAV